MMPVERAHSEMVKALVKPGAQLAKEMTATRAHTLHMLVGICGEAGELLDAIKKYCFYNQALNTDMVVEELGDIEFYLEGLRQELNISRDECLAANIQKLGRRYPDFKYSDALAKERRDKTI